MNKEELRKYLVKDKNINGLTFDKYVERVESMTRVNSGFDHITYTKNKNNNPHLYFSMGTTA